MNRALPTLAACGLALARERQRSSPRLDAQRAARRAAGGARHRRERRTDRHHGPLGLADHRRLGLSDDHAGERRRLVRPAERRRPPDRRSVGPGARRSSRRAMQRLRGARDHAVAEPRRDHLARRQHAEARHRHRHADALVPLRSDASRKARAAGKDGRRRRGNSPGTTEQFYRRPDVARRDQARRQPERRHRRTCVPAICARTACRSARTRS